MNCMIVDDEPIFMMGIRKLIADYNTAYGSNLRVVSEVYDGAQALEAIPLAGPDLVFTDIRMATVDGLTLAKRIREQWPRIRVVVVSGYPSFENAREAFRSNVIDFIQKPVQPALFHDLVRKLEAEHRQSLGEQLLNRLRAIDADEAERLGTLGELGELLGPLHYSLFLLRGHGSAAEAPLHSLAADLQLLCGPDSHAWSFPLQHDSERLVAIAAPLLSDPELQAVIARLQAACPSCAQIGYRCNMALDQLKGMLQLQARFYQHIPLDEPALVRLPGKPDAAPRAFTRLGSVHESKIRAILSHRDWDELAIFVARMLSVWEREGCSVYALEWNMKRLTGLIARFAEAAEESLAEYEAVAQGLVRSAFSYRSLNERFAAFVEREWRPASIAATREEMFARIRDYLAGHLHEPLTLSVLSELFGVSVSYLCSLFKQFTNGTFVELLTELRLRKASELLRATSLPLKDVAELTGYADQRYFSKVFKTHAGMTPSDYRSRAEEEV